MLASRQMSATTVALTFKFDLLGSGLKQTHEQCPELLLLELVATTVERANVIICSALVVGRHLAPI